MDDRTLAEINAFKTELDQCVIRRFSENTYPGSQTIAITAVSLVLAALIKSTKSPAKRQILRRLAHAAIDED